MKIDIYNQQNEKNDAMELPERIFEAKWNPDLVHQALTAQLANRREILAHAKGRGEVSGGGKKPWKQKGTGRARHGSIRSPIWKGGGAAFGPTKERIFARKINKKMNRLAIFSVLSKKLKDNEIKIVENFVPKADIKTKDVAQILKKFFSGKASILLILFSAKNFINKAASNIEGVSVLSPLSLNVYDLLKHKNIIFEKEAIMEIEKHYPSPFKDKR
ncbi:50S ribosomal protein L4 [Candidatus Wolfebacteria bacterium]|nr:50S ribosomal protein L4 [Candidatus Wolfebacteria bacterium]